MIRRRKKMQDLYNRLLEFELEYDIFDTSEYDRTIEHVKDELKDPESINEYIEYYKGVLVAEDEPESDIHQKLEEFIEELNNLKEQKEKELKSKNKKNEKER
jgi:hypothetical protein